MAGDAAGMSLTLSQENRLHLRLEVFKVQRRRRWRLSHQSDDGKQCNYRHRGRPPNFRAIFNFVIYHGFSHGIIFLVLRLRFISRVVLFALMALATACSSGVDPKTIANPVAVTPESLATGKRLYDRLCAECHGSTGHGDGETSKKLAAAGEPKAPDLTDDKWD